MITALALVAITASVASAQIELKNDDFQSNDAVTFHGGFGTGEIGAVRLIPVGVPPFYVVKVRFLFGPTAVTRTITLRIYDDSAGNTVPGAQVFTGEYDVTGSDMAFHEIDLTLDNVIVTGPFRVGIEVQHDGAPSVANDTGGLNFANRNFLYWAALSTWYLSGDLGVAGDWVIRADILNSGASPDAGPGGGPDAGPGGTPDAGGAVADAAVSPDAAGGMFCMVHSECPTGQYCTDDNACTYDCRVDSDCGSGMRCTSLGMCEANDSGGGCRAGRGSGELPLGLVVVVGLLAIGRRRTRRVPSRR